MRAPMNDRSDRGDAGGGRQFLENLEGGAGASALGRLLGLKLREIGDGTVTMEARPSREHYNLQKVVHGGFAATLIDNAMGFAVRSKLDPGVGFGTVDLKVSYVRRMTEETGVVTCRASVVHLGRRMSTAEARVFDARGKLYAHGTGTFMVYGA
jgi:acyl-CoA thioesterase